MTVTSAARLLSPIGKTALLAACLLSSVGAGSPAAAFAPARTGHAVLTVSAEVRPACSASSTSGAPPTCVHTSTPPAMTLSSAGPSLRPDDQAGKDGPVAEAWPGRTQGAFVTFTF